MLDVNIKDSSHFKQNVTHKLDKWGYEYSLRDMGILSGPIIKLYTAKGDGNEKDI